MSHLLRYRQGSALAMPFEPGSFDAAYTQHVAMNIADGGSLYREVHRILRPSGRFGIYDLLQGPGGPVWFPLPWARTPETSFLASPDEMRRLLESAGFAIVDWKDSSDAGRDWFVRLRDKAMRSDGSTLTFEVLLGDDFPRMAENQVRNLMEARVAPTQIICRKD